MSLYTERQVTQAAQDGLGICLECGWLQPFCEERLRLGLCFNPECEEQAVMPCEDAERLLGFMDFEEC